MLRFENSNHNTITYSSYTTINTSIDATGANIKNVGNGGGIGCMGILLAVLTAPVWIWVMLFSGKGGE